MAGVARDGSTPQERHVTRLVRDAIDASDLLNMTGQAGTVVTVEVDDVEYTVLVERMPRVA
jgi:hypothetical protein